MASDPTIHAWNAKFVNLTYATHGTISSNFRRITLDWRAGDWIVAVAIEREDSNDREMIEEIFTDLEAADGESNLQCVIEIRAGALPQATFPTRIIYLRREDP